MVVVEVAAVVVAAVVEVSLGAVILEVGVGMTLKLVVKTVASVAPNVSPLVVVSVPSVVL